MPSMLSANILVLLLQVSQAYLVWKAVMHIFMGIPHFFQLKSRLVLSMSATFSRAWLSCHIIVC